MKAVVAHTLGPPDTLALEEWPRRPVAAGEVRIGIWYAGVSFVDVLTAAGGYQVKPPTPFIPGSEFSGIVLEVGAEVANVAPGDRVTGGAFGGVFAEEIVVSASAVSKIPQGADMAEASVVRSSFLTAIYALRHAARVQPAETVLVLGAGGAVGIACVQVAKAYGAVVIASASSADKRALALANGATHALDSTAADWRDFLILWLLIIPGCLFWATYEQSGNTMEVWSVDHVNRLVALGPASFTLSVGAIQSFNSIFILAFTPLVIWYWKRQEARNSEPSAVVKMALGFVILALSYFILGGAQMAAGTGQVHWIWTLIYFAFFTLGELYFSPVGLSLYAKAAPPQVSAFMMAVFFGTNFLGNFLSGWLGTLYSLMGSGQFFLLIGVIALAPAPIIWAFNKPLRPFLGERHT